VVRPPALISPDLTETTEAAWAGKQRRKGWQKFQGLSPVRGNLQSGVAFCKLSHVGRALQLRRPSQVERVP